MAGVGDRNGEVTRSQDYSSTYHVIFMGNYHPLYQARNNLGREEVLAVAGDRHDAVF